MNDKDNDRYEIEDVGIVLVAVAFGNTGWILKLSTSASFFLRMGKEF